MMADEYHGQLTAEAWDYLTGPERGLTLETIEAAKLGYVETPLTEAHEKYVGRIVIPYFDARGRERSFRFRRNWASESATKYLGQVGRAHLYGVEHTTHPRPYLTEGEFDALVLRQMGLPAIAVPGAKGFKQEWRWLFRECDLVTIVFDPDEDGRKWGQKIGNWLDGITEVDIVDLPDGDITETYVKDPELLRKALL